MKNSKPQKSTILVEPLQCREQVYRLAVERFRSNNPQYDAITMLSTRIGIGVKMLYAVLSGNRNLSVVQQDQLFRECNFPEAYEMLRTINFS